MNDQYPKSIGDCNNVLRTHRFDYLQDNNNQIGKNKDKGN